MEFHFLKWKGDHCDHSEIDLEAAKRLAVYHKLQHVGDGIMSREFHDMFGTLHLIEIVPKDFVEKRLRGVRGKEGQA